MPKISLITLCIFYSFSLYGLTIEDLAQNAINGNSKIKQHISDLKTVKYNLTKANSNNQPSIDMFGDFGRQKTRTDVDGESTNKDLFASSGSLVMTQNLFDGFQTTYNILEQKSYINAAKYFILQETNTYLLKVMSSYLNIIKQKKLKDIEYKNLQSHEKINDMIRQKVEAGLVKGTDLKQSESRKLLAYSNYIAQKNNYEDSIINFERLYGQINKDEIPPHNDIELPVYNIDQLEEYAFAFSPTIKIEQYNIEAQKNKYQKELSTQYPNLDAQVSLNYTDNLDGNEYDTTSQNFMLKFKYNLYKGDYHTANKLQNLEKINALKYSLDDNKKAVKEKLKLAISSYIHNKTRVRCLQLYVKLTKATEKSYFEEYFIGKKTLLDLLNIEQEYNKAKRELINAEDEMSTSLYRILEAAGVITYSLKTDIYTQIGISEPQYEYAEVLKHNQFPEDEDSYMCKDVPIETIINKAVSKNSNKKGDKNGIIIDTTDKNGIKIGFVQIEFAYKSVKLTKKSQHSLQTLLNKLQTNQNIVVEIHGHTDNIASRDYNLKLSLSRAKSVKEFLVKNKISPHRLKIFGHGFDRPVASNKTEDGRAKNRRVEFILTNSQSL